MHPTNVTCYYVTLFSLLREPLLSFLHTLDLLIVSYNIRPLPSALLLPRKRNVTVALQHVDHPGHVVQVCQDLGQDLQ